MSQVAHIQRQLGRSLTPKWTHCIKSKSYCWNTNMTNGLLHTRGTFSGLLSRACHFKLSRADRRIDHFEKAKCASSSNVHRFSNLHNRRIPIEPPEWRIAPKSIGCLCIQVEWGLTLNGSKSSVSSVHANWFLNSTYPRASIQLENIPLTKQFTVSFAGAMQIDSRCKPTSSQEQQNCT